jgi:hypothetical protein
MYLAVHVAFLPVQNVQVVEVIQPAPMVLPAGDCVAIPSCFDKLSMSGSSDAKFKDLTVRPELVEGRTSIATQSRGAGEERFLTPGTGEQFERLERLQRKRDSGD